MSDYYNVLEEGPDLAEAAATLRPTYFRDREIKAVVDTLCRNRSVLLVGPAGAGKTSVIHGAARRLSEQFLTGMRRFTTAQILSGTRYIGDWQSKLTRLMADATQSQTALNLVDVWNLATAGTTVSSRECMLDAMRPRLADGHLLLISEATADQLQEMHRIPKFASLFEIVRIEPLSDQQMREIVGHEAERYELDLPEEARERLFELCRSFHSGDSGPGSALDLLHKVRDYRAQKLAAGEKEGVSALFVEKVFAIHSGLPLFVVSRTHSKPAAEIRDWFRERIVGQEAAIDAVGEMIIFYKARMHDKSKPIGSFLFVGPTGVGKTELARALAEFFFGSERRMLRFDMSEFMDPNSFEMLIGSPAVRERPARLIDPVRAQPFQVVLFDELEKAHRNIQDLFLQLLDEGRLSTPLGETVDFRNAILIATSNVGAFEGMSSAIGFGADNTDAYDADRALAGIESQFRPEFLNRFQHVVLFHPLTREQAARIARMELRSILAREGIAAQNLLVDVRDEVIEQLLAAGFNPRYGARGIKREIRRQIILPLATLLMEQAVVPGTLISVSIRDGRVRVEQTDTPDSLNFKAEQAPVRARTGERLSREELKERITAARTACETLAADTEVDRLRAVIATLDEERRDHAFWQDSEEAMRLLAQQSRWLQVIARIERFDETVNDLSSAFETRAIRRDMERLADRLVQLETNLVVARRELITMGPEGHWDALMEITPVGSGADARNLLLELYENWARERRIELLMVHEPMASDQAIVIALRGPFAHGYLRNEAGLHRVRRQRDSSVARLSVMPWSDRRALVEFGEQRALKAIGQLGGKIRSRIALRNTALVLQNARTLSENRELARDIGPCWTSEAIPIVPTVRRYDLDPFRVRDYLTRSDFSRRDIFRPKPFHELLCARVDQSVLARQGDTRASTVSGAD